MNGFASRTRIWIGLGLISAATSAGCGQPASTPSDAVTSAPVSESSETVPRPNGHETEAMDSGPIVSKPSISPTAPVVSVISPAAESAWMQLMQPDLAADKWEAAQQSLLDLGPEVEPLLLRELQSREDYHRETAATLLAQMGTPTDAAQAALLPLLDDPSPFVRANAAAALAPVAELGDRVVPVLSKLLSSDDPQLRKMAALNLSAFGPEAAPEVPSLAAALEDQDDEVVLPVVQLLGRIGPQAEPAMQRLQQIAFEQEGEIKRAAETAIEQIRTTPAPD